MIKHFCDRCGKEVKDGELIVNKLGCKPSLMLYTDKQLITSGQKNRGENEPPFKRRWRGYGRQVFSN